MKAEKTKRQNIRKFTQNVQNLSFTANGAGRRREKQPALRKFKCRLLSQFYKLCSHPHPPSEGCPKPDKAACTRSLSRERAQTRTGTVNLKAGHGVSPPYPLFSVAARPEISADPRSPAAGCIKPKKQPALRKLKCRLLFCGRRIISPARKP